jgi:hypothetical protein
MELNRQYIVDENNHKIAVQIDIKTGSNQIEMLVKFIIY